jgi:hypothetical protein
MSKTFIILGMVLGSSIGGYLPMLFGVDMFSLWPVVGSTIGGFGGIWLAYKVSEEYF